MKNKVLLLIVCLLVVFEVFAQNSKLSFSLLSKLDDVKLGRLRKESQIAILVKGDVDKIKLEVERKGGVFKYASSDIAAVSLPLEQLETLSHEEFVERMEGKEYNYELFNDTMVYNTNLLPVFLGMSPLNQHYDGSGVVVGIIDNEIDFNHPDFKLNNGKTRIKYLWDQTSSAGNKPNPYNFGTEWTATDIDNGLAIVAKNNSTIGHGTHVAGTAAGNGKALNNYKGAAPAADLVVVVIDFSLSDNAWLTAISDAADYIYKKANTLGKPCVINASLGTYDGAHDARDLQAQLINNMIAAKKGRAFVCAAGNRGNTKTHLGYDVSSDSVFTWFTYNSTIGNINLNIYSDTADLRNVQFSIGADKVSPGYSFRGRNTFNRVFKYLNTTVDDSVYTNGKRIGRIKTSAQLIGNRYELNIIILPDSTSYNWRLITKGSGRIDLWHTGMVHSGLPTQSQFADIKRYILPDNLQTIAGSFTCASNAITVGSYINRNYFTDVNGSGTSDTTLKPGNLSFDSSVGPTRDGRLKPEITAPGHWVLSCGNYSDLTVSIAQAPWSVAAGGLHRRYSGTSMASPSVAGIVALYLQKNPNADVQEIKAALTQCAKRDQQTGSALPNNQWGFGKVDAFAFLTGCASGIGDETKRIPEFKIYPNPFSEQTEIVYNISVNMTSTNMKKSEIQIFDIGGRWLKSIQLQEGRGIVRLDMKGFQSGVYFCRLTDSGRVLQTEKMLLIHE